MTDLGNPGVRKDENFNVINVVHIQKKTRSILGYSQLVNGGNQTINTGVRAQLTNDTLGGSYSTETLWNPINNRINLQDAQVGDYIDVNLILPLQFSGIIQVIAQLDYSPLLDGSQVIDVPASRFIFSSGSTVEGLYYIFKFVVTQDMKNNGIGVMITPQSSNLTFQNSRLAIKRLFSTTA